MKTTKFGSHVDKLFATGGRVSFGSLVEASKMDETIQQKLEEVNTKTIDNNAVARIRRAIERLNSNLDKCGVTVDGRDLDGKRSKLKVPECARQTFYQATANYGGRLAKIELVVIL
jgi:hypothetical protein